jgi:iron complex transport system ATP-binding protein
VLLMRGGLAVASGPREQVLTEPNLETTFGLPLRIVREGERIWVIPRGTGDCPAEH